MGRHTARTGLIAATALAALCCSSCGGGKRFYPVRGTVLANGKPAYGVLIVLHPENDPSLKPLQPSATVRADGSFEMKTYVYDEQAVKDGAPAGKYVVTCVWWPLDRSGYGAENLPDKLQGRYSNPKTSALRAEVLEGPTELPTFELKY
jgi:hypothetical protein